MTSIQVSKDDAIQLLKISKVISKAKVEMLGEEIHENGVALEWLINLNQRISSALKAPAPAPVALAPVAQTPIAKEPVQKKKR